MGKIPKDPSRLDEQSFRSPPLWIHVSQAGRWPFSPREARKRAVIKILDRLKFGRQSPPGKTGL
jgi:hypothetical protein